MKNKCTAVLLCLVLLSLLFGCTHAAPESDTTASTVSTTVTTTAADVSTTAADDTTTATSTTQQTTTTTTKSHIQVQAQQETEKSTTAKSKEKEKSTKPRTTKPRTTTTTRNKSYCTVTIQCKEILSHREKLKDGYEDFVPVSGYLLRNASVKYEEGDTVYTLLQRTCRENGIKLGAKSTAFGMYVYSLNYLPEKACGGTSGWVYYVDGNFPNVSVDHYNLHGGEVIEFKYVV